MPTLQTVFAVLPVALGALPGLLLLAAAAALAVSHARTGELARARARARVHRILRKAGIEVRTHVGIRARDGRVAPIDHVAFTAEGIVLLASVGYVGRVANTSPIMDDHWQITRPGGAVASVPNPFRELDRAAGALEIDGRRLDKGVVGAAGDLQFARRPIGWLASDELEQTIERGLLDAGQPSVDAQHAHATVREQLTRAPRRNEPDPARMPPRQQRAFAAFAVAGLAWLVALWALLSGRLDLAMFALYAP